MGSAIETCERSGSHTYQRASANAVRCDSIIACRTSGELWFDGIKAGILSESSDCERIPGAISATIP